MKNTLTRPLTVLSFFSLTSMFCRCATELHSQDVIHRKDGVPATRERMVILSSKPDPLDQEITGIVSNVAAGLGRFEVFDRNNLESVLQEQALQLSGIINDSLVVKIGNIATAKEALLVSVNDFSQKELLGSYKFHLQVQISKIDLATGKSLRVFNLAVSPFKYTETRGEARDLAMAEFKGKATEVLKELYLMTSEVISVDHGEALLLLGEDIGIEKGHIFVLRSPESGGPAGDSSSAFEARKTAFILVEDASSEVSRSVILRQWGPVQPGFQAVEQVKSIKGFLLSITPSFDNSYIRIGFQAHAKPIHRRDWGAGLWINQLTDSHNGKSYGFDLGLFGKQQLLMVSRLKIMLKVGANLGIAFARDDANNLVHAFLGFAYPEINSEIAVSEKVDIVIGAGYRFGGKTSTWDLGSESNTPAVWQNGPREVDLSGPFIMIGYKQLLFGVFDW